MLGDVDGGRDGEDQSSSNEHAFLVLSHFLSGLNFEWHRPITQKGVDSTLGKVKGARGYAERPHVPLERQSHEVVGGRAIALAQMWKLRQLPGSDLAVEGKCTVCRALAQGNCAGGICGARTTRRANMQVAQHKGGQMLMTHNFSVVSNTVVTPSSA